MKNEPVRNIDAVRWCILARNSQSERQHVGSTGRKTGRRLLNVRSAQAGSSPSYCLPISVVWCGIELVERYRLDIVGQNCRFFSVVTGVHTLCHHCHHDDEHGNDNGPGAGWATFVVFHIPFFCLKVESKSTNCFCFGATYFPIILQFTCQTFLVG